MNLLRPVMIKGGRYWFAAQFWPMCSQWLVIHDVVADWPRRVKKQLVHFN